MAKQLSEKELKKAKKLEKIEARAAQKRERADKHRKKMRKKAEERQKALPKLEQRESIPKPSEWYVESNQAGGFHVRKQGKKKIYAKAPSMAKINEKLNELKSA